LSCYKKTLVQVSN